MTKEEILTVLYEQYLDYKGINLTKNLLESNEQFYSALALGIETGKIKGFSMEFLNALDTLQMNGSGCLSLAFKEGLNIGACTCASRLVSHIFENVNIAGGINKYLIGTKNSKDGSHTWIVTPDRKIYDTTFMMVIDEDFMKEMGYHEENRYNPLLNAFYRAEKDFVTSKNTEKIR